MDARLAIGADGLSVHLEILARNRLLAQNTGKRGGGAEIGAIKLKSRGGRRLARRGWRIIIHERSGSGEDGVIAVKSEWFLEFWKS